MWRLRVPLSVRRSYSCFDEPLSNLDAKLRVQTRTEIKRLLHRFTITSLYVTHDQVEAVALADQIVVMHAGRIQQVGTYQELTENPANLFVAEFFGLSPMDTAFWRLHLWGTAGGGRLFLSTLRASFPTRRKWTTGHAWVETRGGDGLSGGSAREYDSVSGRG